MDSMLSPVSLCGTSEEHPFGPRWAPSKSWDPTMTTMEEMVHKCRNITAVITGIVSDKSPRNCAGLQRIASLGSRSAGFKNLKLLR